MKRILFSILLLASSFFVNANPIDALTIIIGTPSDYSDSIPEPDQIHDSQKPEIPNNDPGRGLDIMNSKKDNLLYEGSIIIIRFFDRTTQKLIKLRDVGTDLKFELIINGTIHSVVTAEDEKPMTDKVIYCIDEFKNLLLNNDDEIKIRVSFKNELYNKNDETQAAKYVKRWSAYEAFGTDTKSFWIPAFQFSSNLRATADGIPFASMPIGAAFGVKRNYRNQFYLGYSLMANWLVYTQPENTSIASSNKFNVSGLTFGGLFDLNDVMTIGCAYGLNLKKGGSDPGVMLVLGFGSKAFGFLKKPQQSKNGDANLFVKP